MRRAAAWLALALACAHPVVTPLAPAPRVVTLTTTGGGEVRVGGVVCRGVCRLELPAVLEAVPDGGVGPIGFLGWSGAPCGDALRCEVTSAQPITARFREVPALAVTWVQTFTTTRSRATINRIAVDPAAGGAIYVGGVYDGLFSAGGVPYAPVGQDDPFVAELGAATGQLGWFYTDGTKRIDLLGDLEVRDGAPFATLRLGDGASTSVVELGPGGVPRATASATTAERGEVRQINGRGSLALGLVNQPLGQQRWTSPWNGGIEWVGPAGTAFRFQLDRRDRGSGAVAATATSGAIYEMEVRGDAIGFLGRSSGRLVAGDRHLDTDDFRQLFVLVLGRDDGKPRILMPIRGNQRTLHLTAAAGGWVVGGISESDFAILGRQWKLPHPRGFLLLLGPDGAIRGTWSFDGSLTALASDPSDERAIYLAGHATGATVIGDTAIPGAADPQGTEFVARLRLPTFE